MTEYIENCEVYAGSWPVAVSHGKRIMKKLDIKARVNEETGEVQFFVDPEKLDILRK